MKKSENPAVPQDKRDEQLRKTVAYKRYREFLETCKEGKFGTGVIMRAAYKLVEDYHGHKNMASAAGEVVELLLRQPRTHAPLTIVSLCPCGAVLRNNHAMVAKSVLYGTSKESERILNYVAKRHYQSGYCNDEKKRTMPNVIYIYYPGQRTTREEKHTWKPEED